MIVACIPAYNEEKTVAKVVLLAQKHVDRVIVCDDGSEDMTAEIAEKLGAVVVCHDRRMGYGAAVRSLFMRARELGADVMVTLDADGQHDPEEIPRLVSPILGGEADVVIGSRFLGERGASGVPRYRRFGIGLITELSGRVVKLGIRDAQSGFRAYGRKSVFSIMPTEEGMGASVEILLKASEQNLRMMEVPIKVAYKGVEASTHNPVYHALDVMASVVKFVSIRHPLLFYGGFGAIALSIGLIFGAWALQIYAVEHRLVTNITLISVAATMIGLLAMFMAVALFTLITVMRERG